MTLPRLKCSKYDFSPEEFGAKSQLLAEVGAGSEPIAVMLTCWELGCAPDQVSHANAGEVMVVQNPGGVVQAGGTSFESILYGLRLPTVRHLIVCGHTDCRTLGFLLTRDQRRRGTPSHKPMQRVRERFHVTYPDLPCQEWLGVVAQGSVLQQLALLKSHPCVGSQLRHHRLLLHGWMRDDQSSAIAAFDPVAGQFADG